MNGLLGFCFNPAPGGGPNDGPSENRGLLNSLVRFRIGIQINAGFDNTFAANDIKYFVLPWEDPDNANTFKNNRTEQISP
jgi:hypothetical protein